VPATLKDIARALGVSVGTVSKALGDGADVGAETRERVLEQARAMGYVRNLVARGLRAQHTRTAGVVLDNLASEFGASVVAGLQDQLRRCGYQSLVISASRHPELERRAVTTLLERAVDGIVFADTRLHSTDQLPPQVAAAALPVVFVNRRLDASATHFVGPDDAFGGYLATEHLIGHGHRRIAHAAGPGGWPATADRLRGYRLALEDYGIAYDESLVTHCDWFVEPGAAAGRRLLRRPDPPSAIFAANDRIAAGIVDAARELGLAVPGQVAIVGYDNRQLAEYVRPALTTVELPLYAMGVEAGTLLVDQMEGRLITPVSRLVRGSLVYRQSCGNHTRYVGVVAPRAGVEDPGRAPPAGAGPAAPG
jgi:DNA-binding LacI/PurR family transcriptional regulator